MNDKSKLPHFIRCVIPVLVASALAGCSLAPEYIRPEAPVAPTYTAAEKPADQAVEVALPEWKAFFRDETMQRVIEIAIENNRDLKVAILNIEKTRAQYRIQRADLLPTINASTGGTSQRLPAEFNSRGVEGVSRQYTASLGFSAFELDLFGRVRNLTEQALETFHSVEADAKSARLSLVAETAGMYLQLVADREIHDLTAATLKNREENLELVEKKFAAGVASDLDVSQAQTLVEEARTSLAVLATKVGQDENYLVLLMGSPLPKDLPEVRKLSEIVALQDIPEGLPSSLLENRPDIQAAEHLLKGTNANIGAARANFFPTISLTAGLGRMSSDYSNLFDAGGRHWVFSPQLVVPIFDTGRNIARLEMSEAERDMAVARYEKTIQVAFREVADALVQRENMQIQLKSQESLVASTGRSYQHASVRYEAGVASYINVLDAQRTLYAAQSSLIGTRLLRESNALALYKALGGGWS
ncbi:efflux transporter outer membrane subunit [Oxalobacter vibrioformis]|uniref:Efflux transporter outer membrane subunit n=1 Tax=Oxalobacter vibrioformis TaxID=933080 RepID=A0A9E9LYQ7_9BURK|nr:efflux transporter outer membrane subunit [Oxalobacter vibrioformis]WAW10931.1 efflux transporter outer membrane subunit [Oxalobacter vibrioformis]